MTTVSISELKANLSRYVREVRRGGEVQVLDRGLPVARLVAASAENSHDARERLIAQGLLRPVWVAPRPFWTILRLYCPEGFPKP